MAPSVPFGHAMDFTSDEQLPVLENLSFTSSLPTNKGAMVKAGSSPEKSPRTSFSSIRENDHDFTQTFIRSKVPASGEAVADDASVILDEIVQRPPMTRPRSHLHSSFYPDPEHTGWRHIRLKGRQASQSCEDLHKEWIVSGPKLAATPAETGPGNSALEKLPSELLKFITDLVVVELPSRDMSPRNTDLVSLLTVSRTIHKATLNTLYHHITFPHSVIFRKFLATITAHPNLGSVVRRIDFSHFNPSHHFLSANARSKATNLTSETLLRCLEMTPFVQEFLAQWWIEEELNLDVLRKVFFGLPELQAIDFCHSSAPPFKNAFTKLLEDEWPETLPMTRVSFHRCLSIPSAVYETILPRMKRLTHLDACTTRITDEALMSIAETARLTHLNLAKCKQVSADTVIEFVASHPAAVGTLTYLNLSADPTSHILLEEEALTRLLVSVPLTLRSLGLKGSRMNENHVPLVLPLLQHLEELAVGRNMTMTDVRDLFYDGSKPRQHSLRYLDISDIETVIGSGSDLLSPATAPLQVIEIHERMLDRHKRSLKSLEAVGWTIKELKRRCWLVRVDGHESTKDSGHRWWKMGAESWGTHKIPVARAEVGGQYGDFMFGQRLY